MEAKTVKEWRKENGITQTKFASMIGIAQGNLSAIEKGERNIPTEMATRIHNAMYTFEHKVDENLFDLVEPKTAHAIQTELKVRKEKGKTTDPNDHLNHVLYHLNEYVSGNKGAEQLTSLVCHAIFALEAELKNQKQ